LKSKKSGFQTVFGNLSNKNVTRASQTVFSSSETLKSKKNGFQTVKRQNQQNGKKIKRQNGGWRTAPKQLNTFSFSTSLFSRGF